MEIDFLESIKMYLTWYNERINCLYCTPFNQFMLPEDHTLGSSFILKSEIRFILEYLKKHKVDVADYESEYDMLTNQLECFKNNHSEAIREKLVSILEQWARGYERDVNRFCGFFLEHESQFVIDVRTEMELIMYSLKTDFNSDLKEIRNKIDPIDEELYNVFVYGIEEIVSGINIYEIDFFPDNFWWRHPSRILEEKQKYGNGFSTVRP